MSLSFSRGDIFSDVHTHTRSSTSSWNRGRKLITRGCYTPSPYRAIQYIYAHKRQQLSLTRSGVPCIAPAATTPIIPSQSGLHGGAQWLTPAHPPELIPRARTRREQSAVPCEDMIVQRAHEQYSNSVMVTFRFREQETLTRLPTVHVQIIRQDTYLKVILKHLQHI